MTAIEVSKATESQNITKSPDILHFQYIDALRGLAFLAVFSLHAGYYSGGGLGSITRFTDNGLFGVQLFFVVSATTLFLSLHQRKTRDSRPIAAFFIRRICRIAPMYWVAILLFCVTRYVRPEKSVYFATPPQILGNVFFLHGWHSNWINNVVHGGWSVGVEMSFYLLVPVLFAFCNSIARAVVLLIASLLIAISTSALMISHGWNDQFIYFWLPNQLPVFSVGILLYFVVRKPPTHSSCGDSHARRNAIVILAIALLAAAVTFTLTPPIQYDAINTRHFGMAAVFFFLTWGLATYPFALIVNPFTRFLGLISYSAYLLHFIVLSTCSYFVHRLFSPQIHPVAIFSTIYFVGLSVTILVSWVTFRCIEKPGIALSKRIIQHIALRA